MRSFFTIALFSVFSVSSVAQYCGDAILLNNTDNFNLYPTNLTEVVDVGSGPESFQNANWFYFQVCETDGVINFELPNFSGQPNLDEIDLHIFGPFNFDDADVMCDNLQANHYTSVYNVLYWDQYITLGEAPYAAEPINEGQYFLFLFSSLNYWGSSLQVSSAETSVIGDACIECPPMESPEICIVTTTSDNHHKIIWEKPLEDDNVASYNIYRYDFGATTLVGSASSTDSSFVVDSAVLASEQQFHYSIETVDSCGTSDWGQLIHNPVHLSASPGFGGDNNLSWTVYLEGSGGMPLEQFFYIYRGTEPGNLELIDSISSFYGWLYVNYTDIDAPAGDLLYQVAYLPEETCSVTREVGDMLVLSNIAGSSTPTGTNELKGSTRVLIYPNPANDYFTIELGAMAGAAHTICLYDAMGNLVRAENVTGQRRMRIHRNGLQSGIYSVIVNMGDSNLSKPVIFN